MTNSKQAVSSKGMHWRGARLLNLATSPLVWATRGNTRFGHVRILELTTVGRKTGLHRTVFMPSVLKIGDSYVLVASFGGAKQHPAWYHNLTANLSVQVTVEGAKRQMLARTANDEERRTLWPRVVIRGCGGYWVLQRIAPRQLPLVILEPA